MRTSSLADIAGTEWVLIQLAQDEPAPAEPEVTLTFEENRIAGSGGCNRYFAGVAAGEMPGELTIGPVGATRMACPEPQMRLEGRFLQALEATVKFGVFAGKLALTYRIDDSEDLLLFAPRESVADRSR